MTFKNQSGLRSVNSGDHSETALALTADLTRAEKPPPALHFFGG
jgi:hypothetical protein